MKSLRASLVQLFRRKSAPIQRPKVHLALDFLEERDVPAVLTVNTAADSSALPLSLSLRDAIQVINFGNAGGFALGQVNGTLGSNDTIVFDPTVFTNTTIELFSVLPTISANVSIQGLGTDRVVIDGNQFGSVLTFGGLITADLSGVLLTGGSAATGGGINNSGNLTVTNASVFNNLASTGGGIFNALGATMKLVNTSVLSNTALGAANIAGGGILNNGTLTLTSSSVTGNLARGTVDITAATWAAGLVTVTTAVPHNLLNGDTVSIGNPLAPQSLLNGVFSATPTGPSTFTFPRATDPGPYAGGSFVTGVSVTSGAGLYNTGALTLVNSTVANNTADITGVNTTAVEGIVNATWLAGVATITTAAPHGLVVGQNVNVGGVTPNGFNGSRMVTGVTANTFTYNLAVSPTNAITTGGNATPVALINNATWNTSTATIVTSTPHGLVAGQTVTIAGVNSGVTPGYNGTFVIINATGTTFTYNLAVDPGTYVSGGTTAPSAIVNTATWAAGTATLTTSGPHGLSVGQTVNVSGVTPAGYNGTFVITGVSPAVNPTSFSYALITNPGAGTGGVATGTIGLVGAIWDADTATATTTAPHTLVVGQTVTVAGVGPLVPPPGFSGSFNGTFNITAVNGNTFSYALTPNPGYTPPGGAAVGTTQVTSASWSNGVATITTLTAHGLVTGQATSVLGVSPAGYNGTFAVTQIDNFTFTYRLTTNPGAGTGGSVTQGYATSAGGGILNTDTGTVSLINSTVSGNAASTTTTTRIAAPLNQTAVSWVGGIATLSTRGSPIVTVGQSIAVAGITPSTYNGTFTVTRVQTRLIGGQNFTTYQFGITTDPGMYVSGGSVGFGGTTAGGGIVNGNLTTRLQNTIVAGNSLAVTNNPAFSPPTPPTLTPSNIFGANVAATSSNNLIGPNGFGGLTSGTNGNLVNVANPGLATVTDNAGSTPTVALLPGSPAINAGAAVALANLTAAATVGDPGVVVAAVAAPAGPGVTAATIAAPAGPGATLATISLPAAAAATTLQVSSSTPFVNGQFLRIGSEIVRVMGAPPNGTSINVLRGQAGTTAAAIAFGAAISPADTALTVSSSAPFAPGQFLRIGQEVVQVTGVLDGTSIRVVRGVNGTTATALTTGTNVDLLSLATVTGTGASATDVSVPVSTTAFLTPGQFLRIGNEIVRVVTVDSPTTVTVLRAQGGTTAAPVLAGSTVTTVDTLLAVSSSAALTPGQILRIGNELVRVVSVPSGGDSVVVARNQFGTALTAVPAGTNVELLTIATLTAPAGPGLPVSFLSSGITDTDTTIPLSFATGITIGQFLRIGGEIVQVTSVTQASSDRTIAASITVVRGQAGTTAAAQPSGTPVSLADSVLQVSSTAFLSAGQTLRIGSELVQVMTVVDATTVIVARGQTGTTIVPIETGALIALPSTLAVSSSNLFAVGEFYRIGTEIVQVLNIPDAMSIIVLRAQAGTGPTALANNAPITLAFDQRGDVALGTLLFPAPAVPSGSQPIAAVTTDATSSATTLQVSDASSISPNDYLRIGNELVFVLDVLSPTSISVARAISSTGAPAAAIATGTGIQLLTGLQVSDSTLLTIGQQYRIGTELVQVVDAFPGLAIVLRGQGGTTSTALAQGGAINQTGFTRTMGTTDIGAFEVQQTLALPTPVTPILQIGVPYTLNVTPIGGTGTVTLTYTIAGSLAPGFTINPSTGIFPFTGSLTVTGTPTGIGSATITVTATDELGNRVSAAYPVPVPGVPTNPTVPPVVTPGGGGGGPGGSAAPAAPTAVDANQIATVSAAFTPTGLVIATVNFAGVLTLTGSFGSIPVATGIRHASVAFGPSGLVVLVTSQTGALVRFDSAGARFVAPNGVRSATLSYGPAGEVMLVTSTGGETTRFDAFGVRGVTNGNTRSASLGFTPFGEVLFVTTSNGDVLRTDSFGTQTVAAKTSSAAALSGEQYLAVQFDGSLVFGIGGSLQKIGTIG